MPYQYIIPQLFKNDIYASYKINKINSEYTDFKIYDGKTKTFNIINIFNGTVNNSNNSNNSKLISNLPSSNMTISFKDFVMKNPSNNNSIISKTDDANNNSIISKIDDVNNNTLTAENIYNISNTGTTENKKISYNEDEKAIEIS
ncbi:hypothetical protein IKD56_01605 [bacterium]|nr:hypothetical protein [bacterium]